MFLLDGSICKFSLRERSEKLRTFQNLENGIFTTDHTSIFYFTQISEFQAGFPPLPKRGSKRLLKVRFTQLLMSSYSNKFLCIKDLHQIIVLSPGKLKSP